MTANRRNRIRCALDDLNGALSTLLEPGLTKKPLLARELLERGRRSRHARRPMRGLPARPNRRQQPSGAARRLRKSRPHLALVSSGPSDEPQDSAPAPRTHRSA